MSTFFGYKFWQVARGTHSKRASIWRMVAKANGAELSASNIQALMTEGVEWDADIREGKEAFKEAYSAVGSCMHGKGGDVFDVLSSMHGIVKIATLKDSDGLIVARSIVVDASFYKQTYGARHFVLEALLIATGLKPYPVVTRTQKVTSKPLKKVNGLKRALELTPVRVATETLLKEGECVSRFDIPRSATACSTRAIAGVDLYSYVYEVEQTRVVKSAKWVAKPQIAEQIAAYVD